MIVRQERSSHHPAGKCPGTPPSDETSGESNPQGFRQRMGAQLLHQMSAVYFDGPRAYGKIERNHLVRLAVHQAVQHILFPRGQPIDLLPRLDQRGIIMSRLLHKIERLVNRRHYLRFFARIEQAISRARFHRLYRNSHIALDRQQDTGKAPIPADIPNERNKGQRIPMPIRAFSLLIEEDDAPFVKPLNFSQKGPSVAIASGDHVGSTTDHPVHGGTTAIVTVDYIAVDETGRWGSFNRAVTIIGGKIPATHFIPELPRIHTIIKKDSMTSSPFFPYGRSDFSF